MPFHDLGLQGDDADAFVHRERLAMAIRLGYDCVATSHQATERLTDKDRQGSYLACFSGACLACMHTALS